MADKPKVPRGDSIKWSAADLARMSEVTPDDVAKAKRRFKRQSPKRIRRLLDGGRGSGETNSDLT